MESFFRNLGLIIDHRMELPVQKSWFVRVLQENVAEGSLFEAFSSNKAVFKGFVDQHGFELKQRRRMFRRKNNPTRAKGVFSQLGDTLRIDVKITAYHWSIILYYLFVVAFFGIFLSAFLLGEFDSSGPPHPMILVFLFFQAALMIFLPYFLLKSGVKQMKEELEREFYYLLQKHEDTV